MKAVNKEQKLLLLDSGIGQGHSKFIFWLGEALDYRGVPYEIYNPRLHGNDETRAHFGKAEIAYKNGSQGGLREVGYDWLRRGVANVSLLNAYAQRELNEQFGQFKGILVAGHAVLDLRREDANDFTIQGDVYALGYSKTTSTLLVPVETTAHKMTAEGQKPEKIEITGFWDHSKLSDSTDQTQAGWDSLRNGRAVIAYLGSGASPRPHLDWFEKKVLPNIAHLVRQDRVQVLANFFTDKNESELVARIGKDLDLRVAVNEYEQHAGLVVTYDEDRIEAMRKSNEAAMLSNVCISMPNENMYLLRNRVFVPMRPIGDASRANYNWAQEQGVMTSLEMAADFPAQLESFLKKKGTFFDFLQWRDVAQERVIVGGSQRGADILMQSLAVSDMTAR